MAVLSVGVILQLMDHWHAVFNHTLDPWNLPFRLSTFSLDVCEQAPVHSASFGINP